MMAAIHTVALIGVLSIPELSATSATAAPSLPPISIERPQALNGTMVGGRLPVVRLQVNGKTGLFLLDMGADHTVLDPAFAQTIGAVAQGPVSGSDSASTAMQGQVLGPVTVAATEAKDSVSADGWLAMPIPALQKLGLAGVLSPQSLIGTGCVSIDLAASMLAFGALSDATCATDGMAYVGHEPPAALAQPMVSATIVATGQTVRLRLDTGAGRTVLTDATGLAAAGTAQSQGAGSGVTASDLVGPVALKIGEHAVTLEKVALKPGAKQPLLGMDALSSARILLRADGTVGLDFPR